MNNKNEYDKAVKRYVNKKMWQIINFLVFPGGALYINYVLTTGRTELDFMGAFFSTFICFGMAKFYFDITRKDV
jgi:hypothetical protein